MAQIAQGVNCPNCGTFTSCAGSYADATLVGQCPCCKASVSVNNHHQTNVIASPGATVALPVDSNEAHPDGIKYPSYQEHLFAYERGVQAVTPNPADYPNTYASATAVPDGATAVVTSPSLVSVDAGEAGYASIGAGNASLASADEPSAPVQTSYESMNPLASFDPASEVVPQPKDDVLDG